MEPDGTPTLLPDHTDPTLVATPSVVYLGKDCAIVGQLVATILQRDYLPHAMAGDPLNRSGAFTAADGGAVGQT